jgi:hypothetical protein
MDLSPTLPDRERSIEPIAAMREGMTRGMMTLLSMFRNRLPTYFTYIACLLVHGSSELNFRAIPSTIPIMTPTRVATVRMFCLRMFPKVLLDIFMVNISMLCSLNKLIKLVSLTVFSLEEQKLIVFYT